MVLWAFPLVVIVAFALPPMGLCALLNPQKMRPSRAQGQVLMASQRPGVGTTAKSDRTAWSGYPPDHAGKLSRWNQSTGPEQGGKLQTRAVQGWV